MRLAQHSEALYQHHMGMSPIRFEMELTEACNLECRFCYNSQNPIFANTQDVLNIFKSLARQGVLEVVLTGGEPLLHPDFEIIAREAGKQFTNVLLQTNGTRLDEKMLALLEDAGFIGLNISLHGDCEAHEYLTRRTGSFQLAMSAINFALASSLSTWVNMTLTNHNWLQVENHLVSLERLGVRNFTFTRFTPTGSGKNAYMSLSAVEIAQLIHVFDKFRKNHPHCSVLIANAVPRCILPAGLAHYSEPCSYGVDRFYVNVHGDLMTCGMSRIVLGNVITQTIHDIKKDSDVYKRLCVCDSLPSSCQQCNEILLCRGGCRAAALATTGSLDGIDPLVAEFKI